LNPAEPPDGPASEDPAASLTHPDEDSSPRPADPGPTARPGTATFTIEGRAAPGLFVVGWLATLVGCALILTAILSGNPDAGLILLLLGLVVLSVGLIAGAGSQGIERRARGRLPYQGPSPFLVLGASITVSIVAIWLISQPLGFFGVDLDGPVGALVSVSVQALVYVGMVRLLVVDVGALDWPAMGIGRLDGAATGAMVSGGLWALPIVLVTAFLAAALVSAVQVEPVSPLPPTGTSVGFGLSLLIGVLIAPLGEEILFRGFATTAWVRGLGTRRGVVIGALVFAFAHVVTISGSTAGEAFGLALVAFIVRLPVAFALGWIFVRRNTIWASFGLHATYNAILLILAEVAARSIG
jgi:membrane protease YdiL (CAAX protease family)